MTLKWKCAKQGCYLEQLPDWAMLDGCFGTTKVTPGDVDGIIRQNGKCLFLEKKYPAGWLSEPQVWTFEALVAQGNAVVVFWCEKPDGTDISLMRVWGIEGYDSSSRVQATLDDFRAAVKKWWVSVYQPGKL